MKIYKQTKTLDGLIDDLDFTENKEEAEIVITGGKTVELTAYPKLKFAFRTGVSHDNLPFEEAKKLDIGMYLPSEKVSNYIYEETADFTCGLIFKMIYKDVGSIEPWVKYKRTILSSKSLLIIGTGNIGRKIALKMNPFMKILTYDALKDKEKLLLNYLREADIVTIHIPDNLENKGFIDKEKLDLMKDNAILINTARGAIVDEDALYNELEKERLQAAFDVFWEEPYKGKLNRFANESFHMTPHTASTCDEFLIGAANDLRNLIKRYSNA